MLSVRRDGTLNARRKGRRLRVGAAVAVALIVLAVASELLLPPLAEQRLRSRLERNGDGVKVEVHATPAVKLLFGRADSVKVSIAQGRSGTGRLGDLLSDTRRTGRLDARVGTLTSHGLPMHDVTLTKRGNVLRGRATILSSELAGALPTGIKLIPTTSSNAGIDLYGAIHAFGLSASSHFRVAVRGGAIVVQPTKGVARLVALTLFRDQRVAVDSLTEQPGAGRYTITATGHLVD
ncbi:MAG: hypothetical protein QOC77_1277 [Thermoleophilaceae bacterium]|nr:hypothetical protein [Thermoleophilaceae bacterium]